MNFFDFLKLGPQLQSIEAAISVVKKYMNDPRTPEAISLVRDIEADPEVKAAITAAELAVKTLTAMGTTNETSVGTSTGGAIG